MTEFYSKWLQRRRKQRMLYLAFLVCILFASVAVFTWLLIKTKG